MTEKELDDMRNSRRKYQRRVEEMDKKRKNSSVCYQKKSQMIEYVIQNKDER